MLAARTPAAVDLPGFRWQVPQAHRLRGAHAVGLDNGVLVVHDVDVLRVMAAALITVRKLRKTLCLSSGVPTRETKTKQSHSAPCRQLR